MLNFLQYYAKWHFDCKELCMARKRSGALPVLSVSAAVSGEQGFSSVILTNQTKL
jgi:hypothetical protein